jgi:hypothetical protein
MADLKDPPVTPPVLRVGDQWMVKFVGTVGKELRMARVAALREKIVQLRVGGNVCWYKKDDIEWVELTHFKDATL